MDPFQLASDPEQWRWLGNLYHVLPIHSASILLVAVALISGLIVGAEREAKRKPAGLRTLTLISTGSCLFTLASILMATTAAADPARIAAGIVTGVGFIGAGVIIRERGAVLGLTTGATIWAVAAVGILAGAGYAAAALMMAVIIVTMLVGVGLVEERVRRPCRLNHCKIHYKRDRGKTRVHVLEVLDQFRVPDSAWRVTTNEETDSEDLELAYCHYHSEHRAILFDLVAVPGVLEIGHKRALRDVRTVGFVDLDTEAL